jgi:general secretion pathway protein D
VGASQTASTQRNQDAGEEGVTINVVNVPIAQAAKVVLGDILGVNYVVDPKIDGKVTVQTTQPTRKSEVIELFQAALRVANAAVVDSGNIYKIVPLDQAATGGAHIKIGRDLPASERAGSGLEVVQLRYVSAAEMKRVLDPIIPKGGLVRADDARNTLTISGSGSELATIKEAISMFDIDTMRGMSFSFVPVRSSDPDTIADDLRNVFNTEKEGPMAGMVRFVGNKKLAAILVISPQSRYVARAAEWIRQLDSRAQGREKQFFTYKVQNRPAKELVDVLTAMFSSGSGGGTNNVSPRSQQASLSSASAASSAASSGGALSGAGSPGSAGGAGGGAPSSGSAPFGGLSNISSGGSNQSIGSGTGSGSSSPASSRTQGNGDSGAASEIAFGDDRRFKIAADDSKNSLVILAIPEDYKKLLPVIETLDQLPNQVLIEATIAEVTLTDDLQFGVRWWFQHKASSATYTDASAGAVAGNIAAGGISSVFPGFSYALALSSAQVTLNALNTITKVNVISSPSLTVLDNKTATLQVGDSVPITTQSAVSTLTAGAPIVNSVSYQDTGVILSITPHINQSGRVILDIQQEVSSVANTTSSGIDSPTIQERKIKTSVVVNDAETLALGGLIQNTRNHSTTQVPVLGDIPLFGNAFKTKDDTVGKTELIILITPRVIRSLTEAQEVTQEFKRKLREMAPPALAGPHTIEQSVDRVLR